MDEGETGRKTVVVAETGSNAAVLIFGMSNINREGAN